MKRPYLYPLLLFVLSLMLFNLGNGSIEVFMVDEARNASCAREMMERGDWIVPTFNYELRTDKPPLHYFFMILSYQLFGFGAFAARFFSALFGALTLLTTYLFTRKLFSTRTALWTTLILLSSINFVLEFHLAVPDPYLIFFICASVYSFLLFHHTGRKTYLWSLYLSLALGFLTKGPVALFLPALVILVFLIWIRQLTWKKLGQLKIPQGAALFLIVAAPWYMAVAMKTNMAWTEGFFLKHNLGRYSDTMEGHGGIYFLSLVYLLAGLLPFSVLLIQSITYWLKKKNSPNTLFLVLFVLIFTLFFSLSGTQLPNYVLPVYPASAILMASFIVQTSAEEHKKYRIKTALVIGLVIGLLLPLIVYLGVDYDANLAGMHHLALYLIPLPLGFAASLVLYQPGQLKRAMRFPAAAFLMVNLFLYTTIFPEISEKNLAKSFTAGLPANQELVSYKRLNPSFVFYYQRKIPVFHELKTLKNHLDSREQVFLITRKKYIKPLRSALPELKPVREQRDLFEGHTTVILEKSPG
jgi:4-amino-4-deoxy-L-arabinose transferase-like glycosyltransferase